MTRRQQRIVFDNDSLFYAQRDTIQKTLFSQRKIVNGCRIAAFSFRSVSIR